MGNMNIWCELNGKSYLFSRDSCQDIDAYVGLELSVRAFETVETDDAIVWFIFIACALCTQETIRQQKYSDFWQTGKAFSDCQRQEYLC